MKKIQITEGQLKRLMVLKEQYEGGAEDASPITPDHHDNMQDTDFGGDRLERMSDSFIRQYKEEADANGISEEQIDELCEKIRTGLLSGNTPDMEHEPMHSDEQDIPVIHRGMENPIPDANARLSESLYSIKLDFQRFL